LAAIAARVALVRSSGAVGRALAAVASPRAAVGSALVAVGSALVAVGSGLVAIESALVSIESALVTIGTAWAAMVVGLAALISSLVLAKCGPGGVVACGVQVIHAPKGIASPRRAMPSTSGDCGSAGVQATPSVCARGFIGVCSDVCRC
jgi:hypothetical protein